MNRWCELTPDVLIGRGNFSEAVLQPLSRGPFDQEHGFIEEWACRTMAAYENQPVVPFLVLEDVPPEAPQRTRAYYRRLLDGDGKHRSDFLTCASEVLALWMERTFEGGGIAVGNPPHGTEPAFDVLSLVGNLENDPILRVIQVKATPNNLASNCSTALSKFKVLEDGNYDAELLNRLTYMRDVGLLSTNVRPADLLYKLRHYRITALHQQDRAPLSLLTRYERKIPGSADRRSLRLVRLDAWEALWSKLAATVHAQLT